MSVAVSVIIPTYNRATLVKEAVESVLRQTYRDVELIVVDDGSTDDTEAALRQFGDAIRYVKQPNRGMSSARNHGIALARGRYVALLDSDDIWLEDKLELQIALLEHYHRVGFVFSDFYILHDVSKARSAHGLSTWYNETPDWGQVYESRVRLSSLPLALSDRPRTDFFVYLGDIYWFSLVAPIVLPSTAVFRRSCIEPDFRFPEASSCSDWEFFARLSKSRGACYMEIETALNRSHEDAVRLTRISPTVRTTGRLEMIERVWKADSEFYRQHQDEVRQIERDLLLRLSICLLSDGARQEARQSMRTLLEAGYGWPPTMQTLLHWALVYLPGGPRIHAGIRSLKRRFGSWRK